MKLSNLLPIRKVSNYLNKAFTHWRSYLYTEFRSRNKEILKYKDIHKGETIFVVGAGPSLAEENLSLLNEQIAITIQYAYEAFLDLKLKKHYWLIGAFKRMKNFAENNRSHADATFIFSGVTYEKIHEYIKPKDVIVKSKVGFSRFIPDNITRSDKFSFDLEKFAERSGTRSLFLGVQLAAYMGANRIVLLGADFGIAEGKKSHFSENVILNFQSNGTDEFWQRKYEGHNRDTLLTYKKILFERNIEFVNATKITREDVLDKSTLEDVISEVS